jgi:hypothetical protein
MGKRPAKQSEGVRISEADVLAKDSVGRVRMGTDVEAHQVVLDLGSLVLRFTPDEAEEFCADMSRRVFELRTGGKLA